MSSCRSVGALAFLACVLLLTVVSTVTVSASGSEFELSEHQLEWHQHIQFVDSLADELTPSISLIEPDADDSLLEFSDPFADEDDSSEDELEEELDDFEEAEEEPKKVSSRHIFGTKLPPKSSAQVLTSKVHKAKWAAFKAANPKKKYKSSAHEQAAFNTFQANRATILKQNNAAATKLNPKPFSSAGPFADISKETFTSTHLRIRQSASASGTSASASGTSASASGTSASASGTSASASGTSASASGTSASASGTSASASGTSASASGTSASASGSSASASGTSASASGTSASASGTSASASGKSGSDTNGQIVNVGSHGLTKFNPFKGSVFMNPADKTPEQRICRAVAYPWFSLHARTQSQIQKYFGGQQSILKSFQDNPIQLCTNPMAAENGYTTTALLKAAYHELTSHPSGTPFINPVVASNPNPPPVRDQSLCGSCWAEAAIASYEAAQMKLGTYKGPLSVQQVLDCARGGTWTESNGCAGGTPQDAMDYLYYNPPKLESEYPYVGQNQQCKLRTQPGKLGGGYGSATISGSAVYAPCMAGACSDQYKYEADMITSVKGQGPFIAYVDATNWQHYANGIYPPDQCESTNVAGNHVIELVGYGQQDGTPYWLVKNSWGPAWGEKGYIKLPFGVNACGIANFVLKATIGK